MLRSLSSRTPKFAARAAFSRSFANVARQPMSQPAGQDDQSPALIHCDGPTRHITLNRPKKLNAMNIEMVDAFFPYLQAWEKSDEAKLIFLKGAGRGLSSGGDVKAFLGFIQNNDPRVIDILHEDFAMFHFIATLKKPLVSMIDGITMGAGGGLAVNGPFRVATERTMYAMPETAIGLFPDVSCNFYLPRLDGELGTYLAMTGHVIKGHDVLYAGIATHFVPSDQLPALTERLSLLQDFDHATIDATINEFARDFPLGDDQQFTLHGAVRKTIDKCFRHETAEEVVEALAEDGSDFALAARNTIMTRSPTSVKLALENVRRGKKMGIRDVLAMEFDLWLKVMRSHDFNEGVTSHVVLKQQPKWQPSKLEDVSYTQLIKDLYETPSEPALTTLHDVNYTTNPHQHHALPLEKIILDTMSTHPAWSRRQLVEHFEDLQPYKLGVKDKVEAVWERQL
ncbi:ClpP/crotonase-like domain-containing protein [Gongronella butleri]|nr:ClpP/crotonase-like domain-containing protein [Gongronella butleri]